MGVDIQGLKSLIDLRTFIEANYIPNLKRRNGRYWALCPFHADKNKPNLFIAETFYKCYACGAHGDVLDIVQFFDNCDRGEAIKKVSEIAGVSFNGSKHSKYSLKAEDMKLFRVEVSELENCDDIPALLDQKMREINGEIISLYSVVDDNLRKAFQDHSKKLVEKLDVLKKRFAVTK